MPSRRAAHVADQVGIRALTVDAKGAAAVRFYRTCNFAPWENSRRMYMLMKDLKHNLNIL